MSVEFFQLVCPSYGWIHIQGLGENAQPVPLPNKAQNFTSIVDAYDYAMELGDKGYDTFYSTASLKNQQDRKSTNNFCASRVVQIDIDIDLEGKNKSKYSSLQEANNALKDFSVSSGLPRPTIVLSGYGVHGYYIFDRDISYNEKIEASKALVKLAADKGFKIDRGVTHDAVRLMRVPDTKNYKRGTSKDVKLAYIAPLLTYEDFYKKLSSFVTESSPLDAPPPAGIGDAMGVLRIIMEASSTDWPMLLDLSRKTATLRVEHKDPETGVVTDIDIQQSRGCEQIRRIDADRLGQDEPTWRAVLSLIVHCKGTDEEKDQWAIDISVGYKKHDPVKTIEKMRGTEGKPHTCVFFNSRDAEACMHCPHAKKQRPVTTPLQLARVYEKATPEDNILRMHADDIGGEIVVEVPEDYPPQYFRSSAGGIIFRGNMQNKRNTIVEEEEDSQDTIVFHRDFWLHRRINDTYAVGKGLGGATGLWMYSTPNDNLVEIAIPASNIGKADRLTEILQSYGIHVVGTKAKLMQNYMNAFMDYAQSKDKQNTAREHFGWHDNRRRFLIGKREINEEGAIEFASVCANLRSIHAHYAKRGDLAKWKTVVNTYNNEGCEPRAFALFVGFGCPLYTFLNMGSAVLHLSNAQTGVGKSTIQECINSIYGHPKHTMLNFNDTSNAIHNRMKSISNLPVCIDEATNVTVEWISKFLFDFSQNREKNRLAANTNAERENMSSWETICVTSGNNSLEDMLRAHRSDSGGEIARILQLFIPKDEILTYKEANHLFHDTLSENYGVAGEIFMQYVVQNTAYVEHIVKEERTRISELTGMGSTDRFKAGMLAVAFVAGRIAHELGLHDIEFERVEKFMLSGMTKHKEICEKVKVIESQTAVIVGRFIASNKDSMISLDGPENNGNIMNTGIYHNPNSKVAIRYEHKTKKLYFSKNLFTKYCAQERINIANILESFTQEEIYLGESCTNLVAGTHLPPMVVQCYGIQYSEDQGA